MNLIDKNIDYSICEYTALKNEMNTRLSLINNQASTAIVTIISAWAAGITLMVIFLQKETSEMNSFIIIGFLESFIFLIPILYFIPLSIKSGENIWQIASLSAYIKVFYEYRSINNESYLMNWETSNNLMSAVNINRGLKSLPMLLFNEEYTILSSVSFVLYCTSAIYSIKSLNVYQADISLRILFISLLVMLGLVGIIAICIIHKTSCMNNAMMKNSEIYLRAYIRRAIELGVISPQDLSNIENELNPKKTLEF